MKAGANILQLFTLALFYLNACQPSTTRAKDTAPGFAVADTLYFNAVLPPQVVIDSILVEKGKRLLSVYSGGVLLKKYRVALGLSPTGPKRFEGDRKTPEGLYHINGKNPYSDYHKNLGISYPSAADVAYAQKHRKSAGGDIKIHGLPPSWAYLGKAHTVSDWTWGCIALSNEEIDELYTHVKTGSPVLIVP